VRCARFFFQHDRRNSPYRGQAATHAHLATSLGKRSSLYPVDSAAQSPQQPPRWWVWRLPGAFERALCP